MSNSVATPVSDGMESFDSKFDSVLKRAEKLRTKREILEKKKTEYELEIEVLRKDNLVLEKVEELYKFLLDKFVHRYAESFSEVVTEGLQSIFFDQDIGLDLHVTDKHGKVWVDFETVVDEFRGQPLESFGGGVSAVQSLLLRILVLLKKDLAKYLILDESLGSLSDDYIENAGKFISELCKKTGIDVLLITHKKEFLDHCDNSYEASLKDGSLILTKK